MGWTGIMTNNPPKTTVELKAFFEKEFSTPILDIEKTGEEHKGGIGRPDNEVYLLIEHLNKKIALVCLLGYRSGEFMYKDMDESMMPYYFNCPIRILDKLSPTENKYATQWREKCRKEVSK
jgi:hypothetical protein